MKLLKKTISFFIISILLFHSIKFPAYASPNTTAQSPVRVAVFLNSFNDPFISDVKKSLEDIQKENENKVQFTFYDADSNQVIQNESISKALNPKKFDLFVINLVSNKTRALADAIYAIGINLASNVPPLSGTNYKFDEIGNTVKLPYAEYTK